VVEWRPAWRLDCGKPRWIYNDFHK
jgi:hypothetical protein